MNVSKTFPGAGLLAAQTAAGAALVLMVLTASHAAEPAKNSPLLTRTGLQGGIAVFARPVPPAEALAAAQTPNWLIYVAAEGEASDSLRTAAQTEGLLGRSLYVSEGTPLADKMAAAVLVPDIALADLTVENRTAWLRLLSPRRGTLVVGSSQPTPDLRKALETWAAGLNDVRIEENGGVWLVARRPADPEADQWTHKWQGPDNRRYSADRTFVPPYLSQWYDWPMVAGWWNSLTILGDGRMFFINAVRNASGPATLECRDLGSGIKLWERPFSWSEPRDKSRLGTQPGRSMMIYHEDRLWLADEHRVISLEAETGREMAAHDIFASGRQIKWMAFADGRLLLMAGDMDSYVLGVGQQATTNPFGRELKAIDPDHGRTLWETALEGDVDERSIGVSGGHVFYHAANTAVACRSAADGKTVWNNSDAEVLRLLSEESVRNWATPPTILNAIRILSIDGDVLFFDDIKAENLLALSARDGSLLWSQKKGKKQMGRSVSYVAKDGTLHTRDGRFDLKTGTKISDVKMPGNGCGPSTMAGDIYVTAFGACQDGDELLRNADLKPDCSTGVVIADGIGVSPAGACSCALELRGYRAFASAPGIDPHGVDRNRVRFVKGAAFGRGPGMAPGAADWTGYGGTRRNFATAATVARQQPRELWRHVPEKPEPVGERILSPGDIALPEYLATQPIQIGDRVVFGDAAGVVRALNAADGKELWQFPIGFGLFGAPLFENGRIYVSAADGWLYCLDATSGELAWKFRTAPYDRLIRMNGKLITTWPVLGGPVLHNGVVYAVAGYQSGNGIHGYALDSKTGAVVWETHDGGTGGPYGIEAATASLGMSTVAGGRLWYMSSTGIPASFDIADGSSKVYPPNQGRAAMERRGFEMTALNDGWILYGGRRLAQPFEGWYSNEKNLGFSICRTSIEIPEPVRGVKPVQVGANVAEDSMLPPAFDGTTLLLAADFAAKGRDGTLAAYSQEALLSEAAKPHPVPQMFSNSHPYYFGDLTGGKKRKVNLPEGALWTRPHFNAMQVVLTPDAVVAIRQTPQKDRLTPGTWQLATLDRKDGADLWSIDLPCRPAWAGLSIGSDGRIVVALWDGSLHAWK